MEKPKVFISYSHKDERWKEQVVTHLGVLEKEGLLDVWVDTRIAGGDGWYEEIEDALNTCHTAVLLISANFLTSDFILKEEVPALLERRQKEGVRVMPFIVRDCAWQEVRWMRPIQARPRGGKALFSLEEAQRDTALAEFAKELHRLCKGTRGESGEKREALPPDRVFLEKLPSTGRDVFGRERELAELDGWWKDGHTHVVSFVAFGGVGKSALVNEWLGRMGEGNYRGAERVYGWSFYSQGTKQEKEVSGDTFIAQALKWFGATEAAEAEATGKAKGSRLAELVRAQKTLLILDGLEPLQYPPGEKGGKLKDDGVAALLKGLARSNNGLCVVTTREKVSDIENTVGKTTQEVELENLSKEAGAEFLRSLGVKGTRKELEEASKEFGNHALALNLLGNYLVAVHERKIRKKDLVPRLMDEEDKGGHAKRVMQSYEVWLNGKPEIDILNLMGLFDRPAEKGAIEVLRTAPAIERLTDNIVGMGEKEWKYAVRHLRELSLLAKDDGKGMLDCHPLVREYFEEKLRGENKEGWVEAHRRIYRYFKKRLKEKERLDIWAVERLAGHALEGWGEEAFVKAVAQISGEKLLRLGLMENALRQVRTALRYIKKDKSWAADEDRQMMLAKCLYLEGDCKHILDSYKKARKVLKKSAEIFREHSEYRWYVRAMERLAQVHEIPGDIIEAIDVLNEAEDTCKSEGAAGLLGPRFWYRKGSVEKILRAFGKAVNWYDWGIQQVKKEVEEYAHRLRGLGEVALLRGELVKAREYLMDSVTLFRSKEHRGEVWVLRSLAEIDRQEAIATADSGEVTLLGEAQDGYHNYIGRCRKMMNTNGEAWGWLAIGFLLLEAKYSERKYRAQTKDSAWKCFCKAHRLFNRKKSEIGRIEVAIGKGIAWAAGYCPKESKWSEVELVAKLEVADKKQLVHQARILRILSNCKKGKGLCKYLVRELRSPRNPT